MDEMDMLYDMNNKNLVKVEIEIETDKNKVCNIEVGNKSSGAGKITGQELTKKTRANDTRLWNTSFTTGYLVKTLAEMGGKGLEYCATRNINVMTPTTLPIPTRSKELFVL